MAKITVKSVGSRGILDSGIGAELRKRRDLFKNPIGAKILIPTGGTDPTTNALEWVLWQEFGTATKVKAAPEFGVGGVSEEYNIPGDDNPEPPDQMSFPTYKGRTYGFRVLGRGGRLVTPKGYIITHPGYPPKRFIRTALADAREALRIGMANAVAKGISGESDFIALENATLEEMQKVKTMIARQMRASFQPNKRLDGRLGGRSPATIFREAAVVVAIGAQSVDNIVTGDSHIANKPRGSRLKAIKRSQFVERAVAKRKPQAVSKEQRTRKVRQINRRFK